MVIFHSYVSLPAGKPQTSVMASFKSTGSIVGLERSSKAPRPEIRNYYAQRLEDVVVDGNFNQRRHKRRHDMAWHPWYVGIRLRYLLYMIAKYLEPWYIQQAHLVALVLRFSASFPPVLLEDWSQLRAANEVANFAECPGWNSVDSPADAAKISGNLTCQGPKNRPRHRHLKES